MNNKQEKEPPSWVLLVAILFIFGGIFTAIVGIDNIKNYYHPYIFGLIIGGSALVVGRWIALILKPIIAVNNRIKNNYFMTTITFAIGFFGLFLMTGSFINQELSVIDKCDSFQVINKYRQESKYRQPEVNSLVIDLNGKSFRLVCSRDYWFETSNGQWIDLCIYKSKLGFDFISVTNEIINKGKQPID